MIATPIVYCRAVRRRRRERRSAPIGRSSASTRRSTAPCSTHLKMSCAVDSLPSSYTVTWPKSSGSSIPSGGQLGDGLARRLVRIDGREVDVTPEDRRCRLVDRGDHLVDHRYQVERDGLFAGGDVLGLVLQEEDRPIMGTDDDLAPDRLERVALQELEHLAPDEVLHGAGEGGRRICARSGRASSMTCSASTALDSWSVRYVASSRWTCGSSPIGTTIRSKLSLSNTWFLPQMPTVASRRNRHDSTTSRPTPQRRRRPPGFAGP